MFKFFTLDTVTQAKKKQLVMNQSRLIGVGGPVFKANNKNVELFGNHLSEIPKYLSP